MRSWWILNQTVTVRPAAAGTGTLGSRVLIRRFQGWWPAQEASMTASTSWEVCGRLRSGGKRPQVTASEIPVQNILLRVCAGQRQRLIHLAKVRV